MPTAKKRVYPKVNPMYQCWKGMIKRCENLNCADFPNYGGRGISVCSRWRHSYQNFLADMGERPPGKTLDRIDNDGNYSPENCRWATPREQTNNMRRNHRLTFNGQTLTLGQWAQHLKITPASLIERLAKWPLERALTEPKQNQRITFNDQTLSLRQWARNLKICSSSLCERLARWPLERALTEPKLK